MNTKRVSYSVIYYAVMNVALFACVHYVHAMEKIRSYPDLDDLRTNAFLGSEKRRLFELICEVTYAEPDYLQRALEKLREYKAILALEDREYVLYEKLFCISEQLHPAHKLIPASAISKLASDKEFSNTHKSLDSLHLLIKDIQQVINRDDFKNFDMVGRNLQISLEEVINYYQDFMKQLCSTSLERSRLLSNRQENEPVCVRAQERIRTFLKKMSKCSFYEKLRYIAEHLLYPEHIVSHEMELRQKLIEGTDMTGFAPITHLIEIMTSLLKEDKRLENIISPVIFYYTEFISKFKSAHSKSEHIAPKIILMPEGFHENDPVSWYSQALETKSQVSPFLVTQLLGHSIIARDIYGQSIKTNTEGSHAVSFKQAQAGGVHFKNNTTVAGLPIGMESAVYWLSRILFGRGCAVTALVTMNEVMQKEPRADSSFKGDFVRKQIELVHEKKEDKTFLMREYIARYQKEKDFILRNCEYVIQAAEHVEGISLTPQLGKNDFKLLDLGTFIEEVALNKRTWDDIDRSSFSEHIILSLLISPSDAKPDNYIVKTDAGKPYTIVGVDNDMAFDREIGLDRGKHFSNVKSILYCLPLMDERIDVDVRRRILELDPAYVVLKWYELLKYQEKSYENLTHRFFWTKEGRQTYLSLDKYQQELQLPLACPIGMRQMHEKLKILQTYCRDHPEATHSQLLMANSPIVARYYFTLLKLPHPKLPIDPKTGWKDHESCLLRAYRALANRVPPAIEEVIDTEEELNSGGTVGQLLDESDKHASDHYSLPLMIGDLLRNSDLFTLRKMKPFITVVKDMFVNHLLKESSFNKGLHESWYAVDKQGRTMLHTALIENNDQLLITFLITVFSINAKTLLNHKDSSGLTSLDIAMKTGNTQAFKALIRAGAFKCSYSIALNYFEYVDRSDSEHINDVVQLTKSNPDLGWEILFDQMVIPVSRKTAGLAVDTCHFGKRILSQATLGQIVNAQSLIPYAQHGRHLVARAVIDTPLQGELYFKVYPELPGVEEAVGIFTRSLIGGGAPYTELIKFEDRPVLVSQGILGQTLLHVMKNQHELLDKLDESDISGLIVVAMLINPEDGKPDNYIVEPHPTKLGKYRLVGVDNDHAFVPALVKEKPDKTVFPWTQPVVQVKTVLYCLNQMKSPVHKDVRNIIQNLDVDNFLDNWLHKCKEIQFAYSWLFSVKELINYFKEKNCFIGVPFRQGQIAHLYEKCTHMKDLLSQNEQISHMELLAKLEPRLAKRYKEILDQENNVFERFKLVDAPFYKQNSFGGHTTVTDSGMILKSMNMPVQETLFEQIQRKEYGPVQALQELECIQKEAHGMTVSKVMDKLMVPKSGDLLLSSSWISLLKGLDFSRLVPSEQIALIKIMQQKNLQELRLVNCVALTDTLLQQCKVENLKILDLRGCLNITNNSIKYLAENAQQLEELNLAGITSLKEIGDFGFVRDTALIFPQLKILNLAHCTQLEKALIEASELEYLNISDCKKISDGALDDIIKKNRNVKKLEMKGASLISDSELRTACPTLLYGRLSKDLKLVGSLRVAKNSDYYNAIRWAIMNNEVYLLQYIIAKISKKDELKNCLRRAPEQIMIPESARSLKYLQYLQEDKVKKNFSWRMGSSHALLSPNGSQVVLRSNFDTFRIWDLFHNISICELERKKSFRGVLWNPDGTQLAMMADEEVQIWNVKDKELVSLFKLKERLPRFSTDSKNRICFIAWSPDGTKLALSDKDYICYIWQVATSELLTKIGIAAELGIFWWPDNCNLTVNHYGGYCHINIDGFKSDRRNGYLSPDGSQVARIYSPIIEIWDFKENKVIATLECEGGVTGKWSHDGKIFYGANSQNLKMWDVANKAMIASIEYGREIASIELNVDSTKVAICGKDKTCQVYDLSKNEPSRIFRSFTDVTKIVWSHSGSLFAIASKEGPIRVCDTKGLNIIIPGSTYESILDWHKASATLLISTCSSFQIWDFSDILDKAVAAVIDGADLAILEFLFSLDAYSSLEGMHNSPIYANLCEAAQRKKTSDPARFSILSKAAQLVLTKLRANPH